MLILRILLLILAWRVNTCLEFSLVKNSNNFGPYDIMWKKYETCRGPKAANVTTIYCNFGAAKSNGLSTCNVTFHSPARLTEIKVQVWHIEGDQKKILWSYKVDKPCQHFAITSIIAKTLPLQQNCVIKKGEYFHASNFTAIAHQFFGDTFFYGEFIFKTVILANQGNVMCCYIHTAFNKKTT